MRSRSLWWRLVAIAVPLCSSMAVISWLSALPATMHTFADFRHLYVAGYMVRTESAAQLYDYSSELRLQHALMGPARTVLPFLRPAYEALLFAPLSMLSMRWAYLMWTACNVCLLIFACWLLRNEAPRVAKLSRWIPLGVLCGFAPLWVAILQGQDTLLLLVLMAASLRALKGNREALAGSLLALGLFKFQIVLPIAFLFLAWRRWRFAKGFLSTAALLAAISLALVGDEGAAAFVASVAHIHFPVRYERMANLHAMLLGIFGHSTTAFVVTLVLSAALWFGVARWRPARYGPEALAVAIATSALVSYYLFVHDWSILVVPLLLALDRGVDNAFDGWTALLMFLAPLPAAVQSHVYWVTVPMIFLFLATCRAARCAGSTPGADSNGGSRTLAPDHAALDAPCSVVVR